MYRCQLLPMLILNAAESMLSSLSRIEPHPTALFLKGFASTFPLLASDKCACYHSVVTSNIVASQLNVCIGARVLCSYFDRCSCSSSCKEVRHPFARDPILPSGHPWYCNKRSPCGPKRRQKASFHQCCIMYRPITLK